MIIIIITALFYVIIIYYLKLFSLPKLNIGCDYRHDLFMSTTYPPLGGAVTIVNGGVHIRGYHSIIYARAYNTLYVRGILKIRNV